MTKEEALKQWLYENMLPSGEEGFNAGWDAAMKIAQSGIVNMEPYNYRQNDPAKEKRKHEALEDVLAASSLPEKFSDLEKYVNSIASGNYAERLILAERLLLEGRIKGPREYEAVLRGQWQGRRI